VLENLWYRFIEMVMAIITTLDSTLAYTGLVFILGLAFHAGVLHTRVNRLDKFTERSIPKLFDDVRIQVEKLEGKIDKLTEMLYRHQIREGKDERD